MDVWPTIVFWLSDVESDILVKSTAALSKTITTVMSYLDQERLLEFVVSALNIKLQHTRVLIVGNAWKW